MTIQFRAKTIGIVATRLAGTDGVTLETYKLVQVLRQAGHQVVFFAGALSEAFQPGQKVPEAHFETSFNRSLESYCFGTVAPLPTLQRQELEAVQGRLERALYEFIADFKIDVLVSENAFSIPMQFPLGLALTNVIEQSQLPAIGHHHDFAWERERFVLRPPEVEEFLARAFPPVHLPQLRHLVINHPAQIELQRRFQVRAIILPNVMEFERLPVPGQAERFRHAIGMPANRKLLLQPTRVVARKGIESTLELAHRLAQDHDRKVSVVITHQEGDEGTIYGSHLRDLAVQMDLDLRFFPVPVSTEPVPVGFPTLADAYAAADLVCYPSLVEGFGNALLEAVYYLRPVLVNRYPIYVSDIAPCGFNFLEIENGRIRTETVDQAEEWLEDPSSWAELVERNYQIASEHFSFRILRERVLPLLG